MVEFFQINYWHWWMVATVLLVLELVIPGTFFLWLAVAAVAIGFLLLFVPMLGFEYQLLIFAVTAVVSVVISRFYLNKHPLSSDQPFLNRRGAEYIGRTVIVTEAIVNGIGRVRIDDSSWRVEGDDCPVGTRVTVISADNVCLKVKPVSNKER